MPTTENSKEQWRKGVCGDDAVTIPCSAATSTNNMSSPLAQVCNDDGLLFWCGVDCVRITANPSSGGDERRTPVRMRGRACADGLSFMKKSRNVKLLNEKESFGMEFHEMITLARLVYFLQNRPNARLHHGLDLGTIRLRFLVDTTPFEH